MVATGDGRVMMEHRRRKKGLLSALAVVGAWIFTMTLWLQKALAQHPMTATDWVLALITVVGTVLAWREIRGDLFVRTNKPGRHTSPAATADAELDLRQVQQVRLRPWMFVAVLSFAMLLPALFLLIDIAEQGGRPERSAWVAFVVGEAMAISAVTAGWFVAKRALARRRKVAKDE